MFSLKSVFMYSIPVVAEAIAGYTFWLSHPYETNEDEIKRLLVYTLGMLE